MGRRKKRLALRSARRQIRVKTKYECMKRPSKTTKRSLKKQPKPQPKNAKKSPAPEWVESTTPPGQLTAADLSKLARDVQKGLRDTPAWKALCKRHGKSEAQRILKL